MFLFSGMDKENARFSRSKCAERKQAYNKWCGGGVNDTQMWFVPTPYPKRLGCYVSIPRCPKKAFKKLTEEAARSRVRPVLLKMMQRSQYGKFAYDVLGKTDRAACWQREDYYNGFKGCKGVRMLFVQEKFILKPRGKIFLLLNISPLLDVFFGF